MRPTCTIEGCDRENVARGWCDMHYRRWKTHGDPSVVKPHFVSDRVCSVEGCGRKHYGNGLCSAHWAYWKRNGTVERRPRPALPERLPCDVPKCRYKHFRLGFCRLHLDRWYRNGDPTVPIQKRKVCAACSEVFRPRSGPRGTNKRRLCYSCAPAPGDRASCLACGTPFVRLRSNHYCCSRPCKKKVNAVHKVGYADCTECGRLFTARGNVLGRITEGAPGYCSPDCRKAAKLRSSRESWARNYENAKRYARKNTALRRARKRELETEPFTHEQVFERDGWRCHLCRKLIDKTIGWPDPMAGQIDHLIPVSLGGPHTLANVAAAHAQCNRSKGARPKGEQLRLVG